MKYARVTMLALAALTTVAFAACASGSDTDPFGTGGGGAGGSGGSGAGTPDAGDVCPSTCGTDLDCQNSCPAAPSGGAYCCDKQMAKCYPSSEAVCPSPVDGGGGSSTGGMAPY